ncbi:serine hydrolase domain-containing protein [Neolewinella lacunae]|uniref:Beta-lactamase family protein n=1 Tax=Neolewinella lacunae TaxID=1517758 RepID=A0A923TDR1_9BACT|nr:serine hydrolase domain-containing protein [Neolewinella lacunae]MBC6995127.1 beta-lactamase family protein [Neolewinella lacunae]MDN3634077.1 serine hydrolase domain-containing protein [Neolewinella lacunae]
MKTFSLLFLLFSCAAHLLAQPLTPEQSAAIDQLLLADIPAGGPGGALGIIRNGEIIYIRYAGLADLDTQRPIDASTRFNVASNAKQFTALAVLRLVEAGQLSLEDDIRKYFPKLFPAIEAPITIAQLINHTSGIRDVYNLWSFQGITWWKKTLDNDAALALLHRQRDLNFAPGSQYLYSNSNYLLLTHIVAQVSGQSFRAYTDQLFQDLGMTATRFADDHRDLGPNIARPYFNFDTWTTFKWRTDLHGDGALFSTLPDQLAWELALQRGEAPKFSDALLSRSQQILNASSDYGFGLEHGRYRGVEASWHNGSTGPWDASFLRLPAQQLSIVASDNSGKFGTSALVRAVADVVLADVFTQAAYPTAPSEVGPEIPVEKLLGTYLTDNGFAFKFKLVDSNLVLERNGRNDVVLELEAGNVYHQKFDPAFKQEFTWDAAQGMQVTAYYRAHAPYTLTRADVDWAGYDYEELAGRYHNDELKVSYQISHLGQGRYALKAGKNQREGDLYGRDRLLVQGYNIRFSRNAAGEVVGLLVSDDRVRNLWFAKVLRR